MAKESKQISVGDLDFDTIKSNLKQYLRNQSTFTDYDFEGSSLSVLLDILAVNTHYNALYNNLAINEAFIDSASKRNSVVSKANELGYLPHSSLCSSAVITLTVSNPTSAVAPTVITLPQYTPFNTSVNGNDYTFYTTETLSAVNNGSDVYVFDNITIKEGTILTNTYAVADGVRFIIPNTSADISTLLVRVKDNSSSTNSTTYVRSDSILNLTETDAVYFIKEIDDGLYEIEFGNNIIGKQLSNGNVVELTYFINKQDAPNGARNFTYNGGSLSGGSVSIVVSDVAFGGAAPEDIDSIRYNAPKMYAAQNRCITSDDYKTYILSKFPSALSVNVWGGEENIPPIYGKVFISIVPEVSRNLTDTEKNYILNDLLAPRKALSITPEIIDPTYNKIELDVTYYYNPQLTTRTSGQITTLVLDAINSYNETYLHKFDGVFKYSKFCSMIDAVEPSITSNITTVKIKRNIIPSFGITRSYDINLGNPIYNSGVPEESILTTGFYCTDSTEICYIDDLPEEDNPIGQLRLYYRNASNQKVIIKNIGTVNYDTGYISIDNIQLTDLYQQAWTMTIKPQSNDIASIQNQVAFIDQTLLTINAVVDYPSKSYTFTSSRN